MTEADTRPDAPEAVTADGSNTSDITPEFRWNSLAGVTRTRIQIAGSTVALESGPPG